LSQIVHDICEPVTIQKVTDLPLTTRNIYILKTLYSAGPKSPWELAEIMNISRPAITKSIDRLHDLQLLKRETSVEDRRKIIISITRKAVDIILDYDEMLLANQNYILKNFLPKELDDFNTLLQKYMQETISNLENFEIICLQCNGTYSHECLVKEYRDSCHLELRKSLDNPKPLIQV